MALCFDTIIKGAAVVTSNGTQEADIGILDGQIAGLGSFSPANSRAVVEARGLHALPGCIDLQVHFREPGMTHKEDMSTGSRAAILGGVTCVMESANTSPPVVDAESLRAKMALAKDRLHCDATFALAATAENVERISKVENLPGCAGIELFMSTTTGGIVVDDDTLVDEIFRRAQRRVMVHAGDEGRLGSRAKDYIRDGDVRSHPAWRDPEMARIGIERIVGAARRHGKLIHVMGLSSQEECALLASCRDVATADVTINHLAFASPEVYEKFDTLALMNPPIRGTEHRQALWAALNSGLIDGIGTDHAPHTLDEKKLPYPGAAAGIPGVQTALPFMLTAVARGQTTLERLVSLFAAGPARVLDLKGKGEISVGKDADIVLVDLARHWRIDSSWLQSKCGWSPFDGEEIIGWIDSTFLRGQLVASGGAIVSEPMGRVV